MYVGGRPRGEVMLYDSKHTIATELFSKARLKVVTRMALLYDEKTTLPLWSSSLNP